MESLYKFKYTLWKMKLVQPLWWVKALWGLGGCEQHGSWRKGPAFSTYTHTHTQTHLFLEDWKDSTETSKQISKKLHLILLHTSSILLFSLPRLWLLDSVLSLSCTAQNVPWFPGAGFHQRGWGTEACPPHTGCFTGTWFTAVMTYSAFLT